MANPFELRGKRVLVVGLARTGVATAQFSAARGANVTATDARPENEIGEATKLLRAAGVNLELGGHREKTFLEQDLIIPSPGVPADAPLLQAARAKGVTIWSEIELADRFLDGRMIGITGSNGKTTTSLLGRSGTSPSCLGGRDSGQRDRNPREVSAVGEYASEQIRR